MFSQSSYRFDVDILKGIAIIAVVFYHVGWLSTGYLGVDVFFAVNGFFIVPSLMVKISGDGFSYWKWLLRRVMRLWPLVLLISAICLGVGFMGMLPDDFENLSQSVIASDLMSQNILSAITTRNYWDAVNEYKPLMHFWYIGILIQFYVVIPLVLIVIKRCCDSWRLDYIRGAKNCIWILSIGSLLLYLAPAVPQEYKFYSLPCRLFELLAGGLAGIYLNGKDDKRIHPLAGLWGMVAVVLLFVSAWYLPKEVGEIDAVNGQMAEVFLVPQNVLLLLTVFFACCLLSKDNSGSFPIKGFRWLAFVGKMSFGIFAWHQVLLAFYRYFITDEMSAGFVLLLWGMTLFLSVLTYYGIEQRFKPAWRYFVACVFVMVLTVIPAGWVYLKAGVIRDVPELNLKKGDGRRGMFAQYCDRIYAYNHDFPRQANENREKRKVNVLVEGVSFGRDFANVLLESVYADKINLSYIYEHDEKYIQRYAECDYLFTFSNKPDVPRYVWANLDPQAEVYGLGPKNFGACNGEIYQHRFEEDYVKQTVDINPNFYLLNEEWRMAWGTEHYIDFLKLSSTADGRIRVFTEDGKFISMDCRHLTQEGARWFAKKINWKQIFGFVAYDEHI